MLFIFTEICDKGVYADSDLTYLKSLLTITRPIVLASRAQLL